MDLFSTFLQNLQIQKIEVVSYSSTFVVMRLYEGQALGWSALIKKFNLVYEQLFSFEPIDTENYYKLSFLLPHINQALEILNYAVVKEEHIQKTYQQGSIYDIKTGISCNNNCLHCVIKPNIIQIKKEFPDKVILDSGFGMWHTEDSSFEEIIRRISIKKDASVFVLTGGEPTIRKDFVAILKWIYYNYPNTKISIQTNGRKLADESLVKAILRYSGDISFAVALHGMEKTHNEIVNNRIDKGNPFAETIQGIRHLLNYFPNRAIRTEIVISNKNKNELAEMISFQHEELGIKTIGMSYPHLCGFSKKDVVAIAPPLNEIYYPLKEINKYIKNNPTLTVLTEEIPLCVYNEFNEDICFNLFALSKKSVAICGFEGHIIDDFQNVWLNDHAKTLTCQECVFDKSCPGAWKESLSLNKNHIIPIKTPAEHIKRLIKQAEGC